MLSTLDFTGSGSDYSTGPPSTFLRAEPWKVWTTAVQSNLDFPDLNICTCFPAPVFFMIMNINKMLS